MKTVIKRRRMLWKGRRKLGVTNSIKQQCAPPVLYEQGNSKISPTDRSASCIHIEYNEFSKCDESSENEYNEFSECDEPSEDEYNEFSECDEPSDDEYCPRASPPRPSAKPEKKHCEYPQDIYHDQRWRDVYLGAEKLTTLTARDSGSTRPSSHGEPVSIADLPNDTRLWDSYWTADLRVCGQSIDTIIARGKFNISLYPHQRFGLWFLLTREYDLKHGGFLADDMGLGKTVQILALIKCAKFLPRKCPLEHGPTLIVCPLAVMHNWEREALEMIGFPRHKVFVYHGDTAKGQGGKNLKQYDIILTTYDTVGSRFKQLTCDLDRQEVGGLATFHLRGAKDPLFGLRWGRVVCDESQMVKNPSSRRFHALSELTDGVQLTTWLLSGTPLNNSTRDIITQCKLLRVSPYDTEGFWKPDSVSKLSEWRATCLLRRTKDQVLAKELKPKSVEVIVVNTTPEEWTIFLELVDVTLGKLQRWEESKATRNRRIAEELRLKLLAALQHLQLCRLHPLLLRGYVSSNPLASKQRCAAHQKWLNGSNQGEPEARGSKRSVLYESDEGETKTENFGSKRSCVACGTRHVPLTSAACMHDLCDPCRIGQSRRVLGTHGKTWSDLSQVTGNPVEHRDFVPARCTLCNATQKWEPQDPKSLPKKSSRVEAILAEADKRLKGDSERCATKVVMFSKSVLFLDHVQVFLASAGYRTLRYDGSMTPEARQASVHAFRDKKDIQILLVSITAGGVGLNLTMASEVWLLDHHYNPAIELQAIDRVHRLGQERAVTVLSFHANNSLDDWLCHLQLKKRITMDRIIDGIGDAIESVSLGLSDEELTRFGFYLRYWARLPLAAEQETECKEQVEAPHTLPSFAVPPEILRGSVWGVVPRRLVTDTSWEWSFAECEEAKSVILLERSVTLKEFRSSRDKRSSRPTRKLVRQSSIRAPCTRRLRSIPSIDQASQLTLPREKISGAASESFSQKHPCCPTNDEEHGNKRQRIAAA